MINENIILKIAKLLSRTKLVNIIKQMEKDIDNDPEIQKKLNNLKASHDDLKASLSYFCKIYPWHHLCKDKSSGKK